MHLAPGPLDRGQAIERLAELGAQRIEVRARLVEQRPYGAAFLVEQRQHEMRGLDELVIPPERHRLGVGQCYLELAGQFVLAHDGSSLLRAASPEMGAPARRSSPARRAQCICWWVSHTTATPATINTSCSAPARKSTRRCIPGIRSAIATYMKLAAATASAYGNTGSAACSA